MSKYLGDVSAYAYAVSQGYTGTETEFAELMADYATVGQQAVDAKNEAVNAKNAAQTAATTATGKATEATTAAQTATSKATEANASATTATSAKNTAVSASQTAIEKASTATTAATTATTAATTATSAKDAAVSAKTAAQTAQTGAETAAESVQESAEQITTNTEDISELKLNLIDVRGDLSKKANVNGYYQEMTVGDAEQLVSTVFVEDSVPYQFRTSGGSDDIGDREYDEIVGGSIVWNQLSDNMKGNTITKNGITWTKNNDGTCTANGTATADSYVNFTEGITGKENHVMYVGGCPSGGVALTTYMIFDAYVPYQQSADYGNGRIFKKGSSQGNAQCRCYIWDGATVSNLVFRPQFIDLTTMFGSTIADYIYSLEQTTAGAGVAFFRKLFPKDYYAYDAGTMMHVSGLSSHDMVGFNAWDEEWEVGAYASSTGVKVGSADRIRCKNAFPVLPNTVYRITGGVSASAPNTMYFYDENQTYLGVSYQLTRYNDIFRTPEKAHYMRFNTGTGYGETYKNDICINLSWDGERDGEYEPYEKHSYPLDDSLTLRGIPKLDENNQLYYDGDIYSADGTVTRKYGIVDLGTLSWSVYSSDTTGHSFVVSAPSDAKRVAEQIVPNVISKYVTASFHNITSWTSKDKVVFVGGSPNRIFIRDTSYTDAATFKTAMSGVMLVYELATPTTEEAEPYNGVQIVEDFGTEEYVTTSLVPVGHNTKYANNLRAKLEMAPDSPSDNGDYIVRHANGQNTYVLLTIPTEIPTAPSEDGTYALKCTVASGTPTYTWEVEA